MAGVGHVCENCLDIVTMHGIKFGSANGPEIVQCSINKSEVLYCSSEINNEIVTLCIILHKLLLSYYCSSTYSRLCM